MTHGGDRYEGLRERLEDHQPPLRRWRAWRVQEPALAGLSWTAFRHELRYSPADRQDELLGAVVRLAKDDAGAVGVVVACLVPGLAARIARFAPGLPLDDAWSIAVAGVCQGIGRCAEPPARFVASRLLDAAKRHLQRAVSAEVAWRAATAEAPRRADDGRQLPDELPAVELVEEPTAQLILTTAIAAGVLTREDAWLLHATLVVGHSLPWAAGQLGISDEAAKKRRQRAEARWRVWWETEDDLCGIRVFPRAYSSVGTTAQDVAAGEVA